MTIIENIAAVWLALVVVGIWFACNLLQSGGHP